jgi:hypothetical protein
VRTLSPFALQDLSLQSTREYEAVAIPIAGRVNGDLVQDRQGRGGIAREPRARCVTTTDVAQ